MLIDKSLNNFLDIIYPQNTLCQFCDEELGFCNCNEEIIRISPPICPYCGHTLFKPFAAIIKNENGDMRINICESCYNKPLKIDSIRSFGLYKGPLKDAIISLKYRDKVHIAKSFGKLIADLYFSELKNFKNRDFSQFQSFFDSSGFPIERPEPQGYNDIDYVSFIPSSTIRFVKRGYNQSQQIAKAFSEITGIECLSVLKRIKNTRRLKNLGREDRHIELINAMIVKESLRDKIQGKKILLIDDIFTTGATLNSAAVLLKESGVKSVVALCVASEM